MPLQNRIFCSGRQHIDYYFEKIYQNDNMGKLPQNHDALRIYNKTATILESIFLFERNTISPFPACIVSYFHPYCKQDFLQEHKNFYLYFSVKNGSRRAFCQLPFLVNRHCNQLVACFFFFSITFSVSTPRFFCHQTHRLGTKQIEW